MLIGMRRDFQYSAFCLGCFPSEPVCTSSNGLLLAIARNQKMYGNYTLRALLPKMPQHEAAKYRAVLADEGV